MGNRFNGSSEDAFGGVRRLLVSIEKQGGSVNPENIGIGHFDKEEIWEGLFGVFFCGNCGDGAKLQGKGELRYLILHVEDGGLHISFVVVPAAWVESIGFAEVVVADQFAVFVFEAEGHGVRLKRESFGCGPSRYLSV